jgi:putative phosphoesterase
MRLGVVSDTHGHVEYAYEAVRMLESLDVQVVLHCGDIGSVEIVPLWSRWPTHFVFGNVDHQAGLLRRAIKAAGQICHDRFGQLELAGRRIALLHGDDQRLLDETIASGRWDLVCHGHTHERRLERIGSTLVLNPGALYRATPHSLAIVDLPALEALSIAL